ncbi:hypothetical protein JOQ06_008797 [Pogonophryne albipinna]|uniref:Uncharacterized protein n=1 Tax=Pogonophryne albipinna TaxID=1090488 RepID=A0AAD6BPA6_9TELE|nr:hypothetical protein JOQ06_008797 [Pogonophryne albipinna]
MPAAIRIAVADQKRTSPGDRRDMVKERARVIARGPVDQYGCVRWCPEELPAGETEATLDEIKRQLCNMYSEEGMGGSERAEPLMEKTYIIQRRYLNSLPAPDIEGIKGEWPFLFSQRGLYSHFGLLTDISILMKLQEALNNKGSTVIRFCQELNRHPGIEDILANYVPEPCATVADVQRTMELPSTPYLIVQGDMMNPKAWMLCIDQVVVMGPHDHFVQGVAALFASYYAFNLHYPEHGSSTLEFIQRNVNTVEVSSL